MGEEEMVAGALNVPLEVGLERMEKVPAAAPPGVRVPAAGSEGDGVEDWAAGEGDVVAEGPCPVLVAKEDTVGAEVSVGAKVWVAPGGPSETVAIEVGVAVALPTAKVMEVVGDALREGARPVPEMVGDKDTAALGLPPGPGSHPVGEMLGEMDALVVKLEIGADGVGRAEGVTKLPSVVCEALGEVEGTREKVDSEDTLGARVGEGESVALTVPYPPAAPTAVAVATPDALLGALADAVMEAPPRLGVREPECVGEEDTHTVGATEAVPKGNKDGVTRPLEEKESVGVGEEQDVLVGEMLLVEMALPVPCARVGVEEAVELPPPTPALVALPAEEGEGIIAEALGEMEPPPRAAEALGAAVRERASLEEGLAVSVMGVAEVLGQPLGVPLSPRMLALCVREVVSE